MARSKLMAKKHRASAVPVAEVTWSRFQLNQKAAHACAICDDGGGLVICDGPCLRHFHLNLASDLAPENDCPGVGLLSSHKGPWMCLDCRVKQATCAQCGKKGSFEASGADLPFLRQCPDTYCVRFYCFSCLPVHERDCPLHKCRSCGEHDDELWTDHVFCPRCPSMWHLDCLKRQQSEGYACDRDIFHHSAHGVDRWFLYCHRHAIDPSLDTPARDHISWLE